MVNFYVIEDPEKVKCCGGTNNVVVCGFFRFARWPKFAERNHRFKCVGYNILTTQFCFVLSLLPFY
jgi:hypothetical protein